MNFPIIQQHSDLIQAVDAKELYEKLGLHAANWKRWHVSNIKANPFAAEGVDYQGFIITMSGNETQNYLLSIDFAKKLAMQVKTDKGEQVRDYFLACERQAKEPVFQIPQTLGEALQLAANQALQIEQDAPKVNFYNTVAASDVTMTVSDVAKKIGLTAQKLNTKLVAIGAYDGRRLPKKIFAHGFIDSGYGVMKLTADGRERNLITQAGQIYILDLFGV